ncbi:hypothetical protein N473_07470 [Pseudoalteromonas luteoviolacea CPMOR-1]|uniref:Uncharacterized protein n=2 Tax=Pseudoalteromonas luteoviolacea TaxID=43657 RepID=A0A167NH08_9GAMM|nr:hypothetical protein N473_07470 [Pseudoalteromonas luteoviolacea CPMOR-1]
MSASTIAASSISHLEVAGKTAIFTLSNPKTHQVPNCVSAANHEKWAVNLSSLQGQATYSLLVTALSKGQFVTVNSASYCDTDLAIEVADGVSLTANTDRDVTHAVALYKGGGTTKIGKVIGWSDKHHGYVYTPLTGSINPDSYWHYSKRFPNNTVFITPDCSGDMYGWYYENNPLHFYEAVNSYLTYADGTQHGDKLSDHGESRVYEMVDDTTCQVRTGNVAQGYSHHRKMIKTTHPLCGEKPCVIK